MEQRSNLDFLNASRINNLLPAVVSGQPVVLEQLNAAIEGLAQKDNVRVSTQGNISIASPGAAIDGITMVAGDRVLVRAQTTTTENGVYIWNGAAVPMTRSLDSNTFDELESAIVPIDEGTDAGKSYRQTAVNGVIGTNPILWVAFGTGAAAATELVAGVARIATQAITNAGTNDTDFITPLKLASSPYASKGQAILFGDGSATVFVLTHTLNTQDVQVQVRRAAAPFDIVGCDIELTSSTSVTIRMVPVPTANQFRAIIDRVA